MGVPSTDAEECLQVLRATSGAAFQPFLTKQILCVFTVLHHLLASSQNSMKKDPLSSPFYRGESKGRGVPDHVQGHPAKGRARFPSHVKLESLCVNLQFYCLYRINTTLDSEQTKSSQSDPRKDLLQGRCT